ncbi:hypothetical protein TcasGA2_TC033035 [Tribolium castaneum]|uniref:Uncharacterized protein n=1 Tax=Tribolium castaneum TaxID=7070 RepID=A0A139WI90_TRICA|nr:PREDICTED: uncharacterized protein LOC103312904 [Tribolium castaneum]KYB27555.1 hypothetical protein TcasGA2_TC033035 [Tribolium castaneum]|eukprot:XP_008192978.1 PREDICTED: uncharacterized protein LOC103312904 [Tribolium castaneum]
MKFLILIQVWTVFAQVGPNNRGYYWRDYKYKVPEDAVSCGKDSNGQETYVGQAYIHNDGVIVVQIFPAAKEIFAASYGLKKATMAVKILCAKSRDKFAWLRTNSKYFHVNVTDRNPVIGGFNHRELQKGILHVGRVVHHVEARIGSIDGFLENAKMNYVHGTTLQAADDFEVLLYNDKDDERIV